MGFNHVSRMLADTIKICESVKHSSKLRADSSRMPFGLQNTTRVVSDHMKKQIQIQSGPNITNSQAPTCGTRRDIPDGPCPIHKKAKHTVRQCRALSFKQ